MSDLNPNKFGMAVVATIACALALAQPVYADDAVTWMRREGGTCVKADPPIPSVVMRGVICSPDTTPDITIGGQPEKPQRCSVTCTGGVCEVENTFDGACSIKFPEQ